MIKEIILDTDPIIRMRSLVINKDQLSSHDFKSLLEDLKDTLQTFKYGVAISAIQIGVPKRIFLIQRTDKDNKRENPRYYINPEIVNTSEKEVKYYEACLSINYSKTLGEVLRKSWVRIKYWDEKGNENIKKFDSLDARIILHELDHLEGKLFTDIVDKKSIKSLEEYLKYLKEKKERNPSNK